MLADTPLVCFRCPNCGRLFVLHQGGRPQDPGGQHYRPNWEDSATLCAGWPVLVDRPEVISAYMLGGKLAVDDISDVEAKWPPK